MRKEDYKNVRKREENLDEPSKKRNENLNGKEKGPKAPRNYTKIVGRAIAVLILLGVSALGIVGYYMFNLAIDAKSDKSLVFEDNKSYTSSPRKQNEFFKTHKYKDRYIKNDGLKLHAYDFNQGSDVYVINVHGYTSEGANTGASSEKFYDRGYNVLAVDCRAHGKSEGEYIGMGWLDRKDIVAWINELVKNNNKVKIIMYGVSMGGATVMNTTGEALPPNVQLAIEDCGYTTSWDVFTQQMKEIFGLPSFPIMNSANLVTELKAGYSLKMGPVDQVKKAKIPTLYIHGTDDRFVPFSMLDEVYEASRAPGKEKLEVEGAAHSESISLNPDLYWNTINKFIEKNIN